MFLFKFEYLFSKCYVVAIPPYFILAKCVWLLCPFFICSLLGNSVTYWILKFLPFPYSSRTGLFRCLVFCPSLCSWVAWGNGVVWNGGCAVSILFHVWFSVLYQVPFLPDVKYNLFSWHSYHCALHYCPWSREWLWSLEFPPLARFSSHRIHYSARNHIYYQLG